MTVDQTFIGITDTVIEITFYLLSAIIWYWTNQEPDVPLKTVLRKFSLLTFLMGSIHVVTTVRPWYPLNQSLDLIKIVLTLLCCSIAFTIIFNIFQFLGRLSLNQFAEEKLNLQQKNIKNQEKSSFSNSEEIFKAIFEKAWIGLAQIGLEGDFLQVNTALSDLFGYSKDEILKLKYQDFINLENEENFISLIDHLLSKEMTNYSSENNFLRRDGTLLWVYKSLTLLCNSNDEPICLIGVFEDLTKRKKNELKIQNFNQDLEKKVQSRTAEIEKINNRLKVEINKYIVIENLFNISQERLEFLLNSSPSAIYTSKIPEDYGATYMSQTIASITGYNASEFVENSSFWSAQIHPDDLPKVLAQISEILETKTTILEYRFLHKNGTYRWIRDELKLIYDQANQPQEIIGYMIDITERKHTEEVLRESEERFRSMANSAPVLIWMTDAEGKIHFVNQVWLDFTGRTLDQELGDGWQEYIHPDDLQGLLNICPSNSHKIEPFITEFRLRRWDGEYRWVLDQGIPRITSEGDFLGFIGSCIDITERKQAEELLFTLNRELLHSNQELEEFAYVASHDLQEPLRMIRLFTQLLEKKYQNNLDSDTQTYLYYIIDAVTRMQQLIQDLLDYSQVETGHNQADFQSVDCNQVLQQVFHNMQITLTERVVRIDCEQLPTVKADEKQLVILFENLISNAIKYCPPQVHPHIKIAVQPYFNDQNQTQEFDLSRTWCFSISDNGIGIQPENFQRIFKVFQRLHQKNEYPGTGIGLAICQKIVERHDGKIWVESEINQGSTFYFTLKM